MTCNETCNGTRHETRRARRSVRSRAGYGGFTMVELLVSIAILSVLALGALPVAELTVRRAKEQELRQSLRSIRTAIDAYKKAADENRIERGADASGYPPTLEVLVDGVPDAKDAARKRIYFLRRLPRDPLAEDAGARPADTWGLRSYASPADAPLPGKDVFDIYSRASGAGLNGVAYRDW